MKLLTKANGNLPRTKEEKEKMIEEMTLHYGRFLKASGFDFEADENSKDTPRRVAKAWLSDIVSGCVNKEPVIKSFPNTDGYEGMVVQTFIPVRSLCSHHNLPISGYAHVAYIPSKEGKVIGLSKLNRIVAFITKRPQLQESATKMILDLIDRYCEGNQGVAVILSCKHFCTCHRGVFEDSVMNTMLISGNFALNDSGCKDEFLKHIELARETRN